MAANDTSSTARSQQVAACRSRSETEKLLAVRDLRDSVDRLARVGIWLDHPTANETEVLRHLAARRFGSELGEAASGPAA